MIGGLARKLFGSSNERRIRTYQGRVDAINALEPELIKLAYAYEQATNLRLPPARCRRSVIGASDPRLA